MRIEVIYSVQRHCRFFETQCSGHPSAASRVNDSGSSPAKDRRSTTVAMGAYAYRFASRCLVYFKLASDRLQRDSACVSDPNCYSVIATRV